MKKTFALLTLLLILAVNSDAKGLAHAAYRTGKFIATLSPVKAVKVSTYPVRHPKKAVHATEKAAW